MIKIPELLSPAGDKESFYAAVNNGADAVYLGGKLFSARASADNFTDSDFDEIIEYAHLRGVKINLTLNTLYKNSEIEKVLEFANKMYNKGIDAFIVQDIGIANEIKNNFPNVKLHASTQMNVHSLEGVKYFEDAGFDRVVLSRELSLKEIKHIKDNSKIQIETFVHGALCFAYSGECLMSSLIGGRSGNRGKCAQPCRMNYSLYKNDDKIKEGYLLSPKDVMTIEILDKLVEANIDTLKIEGRMKSPEYVAHVTKGYREALDNIKNNSEFVNQENMKNMLQIFNRGGSTTTGYYFKHAGKEMISDITPKSTGIYLGKVVDYRQGYRNKCVILLEDDVVAGDGIEIWTKEKDNSGAYVNKSGSKGDILEVFVDGEIARGDKVYKSFDKAVTDKGKWLSKNSKRQLTITGELVARKNENLTFTLTHGDIKVEVKGDIPEKAEKMPTSGEKIIVQLSKTGNTPYTIDFKSSIIDDDIFINMSSLNELRRQAIEEFENIHKKSFSRNYTYEFKEDSSVKRIEDKKLSVRVRDESQFYEAVKAGCDRVYFPVSDYGKAAKLSDYAADKNCEFFVYFSMIDRDDSEENTKIFMETAENSSITGYLLSTYGQLNLAQKITTKKIILDYTFNVFNYISQAYFADKNIGTTLSLELNLKDMDRISGGESEVIIHGNQVLMASHQCLAGIYDGNKEDKKYCRLKGSTDDYYIIDRKDEKFETVRDCDNCIQYILNSQKLCTINKITDLLDLNVGYLRINLNKETKEETQKVVSAYKNAVLNKENDLFEEEENLTYGHFYRGVE